MSSMYVNRRKNGSWRILETIYTDGKPSKKSVPIEAYHALGIDPKWTLEQARARVKQINTTKSLDKKTVAAAARRAKTAKLIQSAFLPEEQVGRFIDYLKKVKRARVQSQKFISYWHFAQNVIAELKTEPQYYRDVQDQIYVYFADKKISHSYSKKIISMLNLWGGFVCREQRQFFEPIQGPRGPDLNMIKKASNARGGSAALLPAALAAVKDKFPSIEQYNWCLVTVWFGLRPDEATKLIDPKTWELEDNVLWVYQSKLESSLPEEDCWKPIPVIYPEQRAALEHIQSGALKRPLNKVLKALTNCTGYGGRKGFTDLMLGLGQNLEQISMWMGHTSIERTWRSYKSKKIVQFNPPKKAS